MLAHRKQRQLEQPVARELRLNRTQRIGAGDHDGTMLRLVVIAEWQRLEAQHRRSLDLKTPGLQVLGGDLIIRMRARDENSHISSLRRHGSDLIDDCTLRPHNATA
jgi:hypothetical protein